VRADPQELTVPGVALMRLPQAALVAQPSQREPRPTLPEATPQALSFAPDAPRPLRISARE
jgi:hypothetical protein